MNYAEIPNHNPLNSSNSSKIEKDMFNHKISPDSNNKSLTHSSDNNKKDVRLSPKTNPRRFGPKSSTTLDRTKTENKNASLSKFGNGSRNYNSLDKNQSFRHNKKDDYLLTNDYSSFQNERNVIYSLLENKKIANHIQTNSGTLSNVSGGISTVSGHITNVKNHISTVSGQFTTIGGNVPAVSKQISQTLRERMMQSYSRGYASENSIYSSTLYKKDKTKHVKISDGSVSDSPYPNYGSINKVDNSYITPNYQQWANRSNYAGSIASAPDRYR